MKAGVSFARLPTPKSSSRKPAAARARASAIRTNG